MLSDWNDATEIIQKLNTVLRIGHFYFTPLFSFQQLRSRSNPMPRTLPGSSKGKARRLEKSQKGETLSAPASPVSIVCAWLWKPGYLNGISLELSMISREMHADSFIAAKNRLVGGNIAVVCSVSLNIQLTSGNFDKARCEHNHALQNKFQDEPKSEVTFARSPQFGE